jgi:3-deoxy-D-manno-octulosonic-acid transferase
MKKLVETYNNKTFVMTSVTKIGVAAAKEISGKLFVHQFPLDIAHLMSKAFRTFRPSLIILVETELWPNMLNQAYKHKVPVIIINARLTQKSYRRYRLLKFFMPKEFSTIKMICAQSEMDATRFQRLKYKNVINANNLKFSIDLPNHEMHILRNAWEYKFSDFIIAFGCSRPGEEAMMQGIYERLKPLIKNLKIIIAPRHIHRIPEITALFQKDEYTLFTESKSGKPILIVDEMGVLPQIYALSNIVVIGGSFFNFGGHNPLEAVWYEKPVIMGEYHQSCLGTVEKLLTEKAIIISNTEKLFNDILTLYQNTEQRIQIGIQAKKILLDNQFALENHWSAITKFIY